MKKTLYFAIFLFSVMIAGCGGGGSTTPDEPTDLEKAQAATSEGWVSYTGGSPDYTAALAKFDEAIGYYPSYYEAYIGRILCSLQLDDYATADTAFAYLWTNRNNAAMTDEIIEAACYAALTYKANLSTGLTWLTTNKDAIYTILKDVGTTWKFTRNSVNVFAVNTVYVLLAEMYVTVSGTEDTVAVNITTGAETAGENSKYDDLERAAYCITKVNSATLSTTFGMIRTRVKNILTGYGFTF